MEIHRALSQISEIHEHLAKGEVFRDYRSLPTALSGLLALLAATLQARVIGVDTFGLSFIFFWIAVAVLGALIAGGGIIRGYLAEPNPYARRRTLHIIGQFGPCVAAGLVLTVSFGNAAREMIAYLPGLWAVLFSLGLFASRPYLPRIMGYVAAYYLVAGALLLALAPRATSLSPWGMGLTFGFGQLLAALVLYWNLERKENGQS